jgi:hypothetical protein
MLASATTRPNLRIFAKELVHRIFEDASQTNLDEGRDGSVGREVERARGAVQDATAVGLEREADVRLERDGRRDHERRADLGIAVPVVRCRLPGARCFCDNRTMG